MVLSRPIELRRQKDGPFSTDEQNAKGGSQELPGVTSKFDHGVQNEAGQRILDFCKENTLIKENIIYQQCKR